VDKSQAVVSMAINIKILKKFQEVSLPAEEWLASQEGLYSMEIVNVFLDVKRITGNINIWSEDKVWQFRLSLRSTYWVSYESIKNE